MVGITTSARASESNGRFAAAALTDEELNGCVAPAYREVRAQ
jgi:hypothetical protein